MPLEEAGKDDMPEANVAMAEVAMSIEEAIEDNVSELSSSDAKEGVTSDDEGSATTNVESASSKMGTPNVSSFLHHLTYSNVLCILLQYLSSMASLLGIQDKEEASHMTANIINTHHGCHCLVASSKPTTCGSYPRGQK